VSDIVEFLRARLEEDEQVARAAGDGEWATECDCEGSCADLPWCRRVESADLKIYDEGGHDSSQAQHIARHDPARVLREVEAKRQIIDLADDATSLDLMVDGERRIGTRDTAAEPFVGDVILRQLASAWSDHPDYREGWRP
jgi:hypothetical protein